MTPSQLERANRFRALRQEPGFFVIANARDAGSARILAGRRYNCSLRLTAAYCPSADAQPRRPVATARIGAVPIDSGFADCVEDAAPRRVHLGHFDDGTNQPASAGYGAGRCRGVESQ